MEKPELYELETSLKNYFLNSNEDNKGPVSHSNQMKYRGLSITMDESDKSEPAFKVRIGAFEASFRIRDGLKVHGSLCGDEKIVIKWFYRGSNKQTLRSMAGKIENNNPQMVQTNYVKTDLNLK